MNRRELIQCASILITGMASSSELWALSKDQKQFIDNKKAYGHAKRETLFGSRQRSIVANAAEAIIPRTDTPGAIDANVPQFIEVMVVDWLNDAEKKIFYAGLITLDEKLTNDDPTTMVTVLEAMEAEAKGAAWFDFGNINRIWDSEAPFICQFKELVVLGFFFSETGARQVLRENPMGSFNGDIPLIQSDTSYGNSTAIRSISTSDK